MINLNLNNKNLEDNRFIIGIDHVGIAVSDVRLAAKDYELFGFQRAGTIAEDLDRNVKILFMQNGAYKIELISTLNSEEPTPILRYLKNENPIYHICYSVLDVEKYIFNLRNSGFILVAPPLPAIAFDGNRVAFMIKKGMGLIELLET